MPVLAAKRRLAKKNFIALEPAREAGLYSVDADEVSYPAHVVLRYEIERALISGDIEVETSRLCGDEKCRRGSGYPPKTTPTAVCRISTGPTADSVTSVLPTLGAMYAARLFPCRENGCGLRKPLSLTRSVGLLFDWLRQNVWQHGSRFTTSQLITRGDGEDLNIRYFVNT